jgi:chromosomal replication initiator protein
MVTQSLWEDALSYLSDRVPKQVFETWFIPLDFQGVDKSCVKIGVPNKFFGEWLINHYEALIGEALKKVSGDGTLAFSFVPRARRVTGEDDSASKTGSVTPPAPIAATRSRKGIQLNPKYTFDTFVVGGSNQFAHAACRAVADRPAQAYNPLFIYGGVGLGKTHLLNAIGNQIAVKTDLRIAYVTTEQFTNEVINSIRYDKMIDLRKRYRTIDMLLIDDIQFLAGKERTQEEFFHTFNALYEARKQIVLSSDRFPKEMPDVDERLRSRFEWGLIADIQPPDVETRIAILRKKSEDEGVKIPDDVIHFIATTMKNNIRELEGSLTRLGAFSSLTGQPIAIDMAKNVLRDMIGEKKKIIAMDDIEETVATKFHVKVSELKSRRRSKTVVVPRQVAMYLCRELTSASYPEIGRHFGGKDHTTIMHACRQIAKAREIDAQLDAIIEGLKDQITKGA